MLESRSGSWIVTKTQPYCSHVNRENAMFWKWLRWREKMVLHFGKEWSQIAAGSDQDKAKMALHAGKKPNWWARNESKRIDPRSESKDGVPVHMKIAALVALLCSLIAASQLTHLLINLNSTFYNQGRQRLAQIFTSSRQIQRICCGGWYINCWGSSKPRSNESPAAIIIESVNLSI